MRVYLDGATESYHVGLGENVFVGGRDMAFNADGSRAAFCATSYPPAVEGQESQPLFDESNVSALKAKMAGFFQWL